MNAGVVRFITAGSVDDGKSTLIGRLLFDCKAVLSDQIQALSAARHNRVRASDADFDLALLTDGLEAEREQGITIDVAYRYFATARKKFIVADAPGHEQYTRNLVTGASQSDAAIILVDPTRLDIDKLSGNGGSAFLLTQTKRHTSIVRLLNLKHVVFAINKMDLFDFSEQVFGLISHALVEMSQMIGISSFHIIPISALKGDNIVFRSENSDWYQGPTLLEWLESIEHVAEEHHLSLRFPIQYVARQGGQSDNHFRGYLGQIAHGSIKKGQKVKVLPSGLVTEVAEIMISNSVLADSQGNESNTAKASQSIVLQLVDNVDVSRGDLIVSAEESVSRAPTQTKHIEADICWLDKESLSLSRKYCLRHTTREVFAKIKNIDHVLNVHTLLADSEVNAIKTNDIARVELVLQSPIDADVYEQSVTTGAFVLIDDATLHTVAAGMIRSLF